LNWGDAGVTYLPIPSEPGYYAGSDGSIWSLKGKSPLKRKANLTTKNRDRLYISFAGRRNRSVHTLIIEAFVGPRPEGLECCHNDGNSLNNRPENLRWDTRKANAADAVKHGVCKGHNLGETHPRSVMTSEQVLEIVRAVSQGERPSKVARRLGLSVTSVFSVVYGRTWGHITGIMPKK
jgi:hypothetical protein